MLLCPNHRGMPVLEDDREPDYLRRKVLTSRNVRGSRLVDFALGGLNYQIEHHRALQGVAGATLAPSTLSLLRSMFLDPGSAWSPSRCGLPQEHRPGAARTPRRGVGPMAAQYRVDRGRCQRSACLGDSPSARLRR